MSAGTFSQQISSFNGKTRTKLQQVRRGATIALFNSVVQDTPVLTGRARGNWRISEGKPELAEINRDDTSGQIVQAEIASTVAASSGDTPIFMANNLPYIEPLENGYSKKAPEGMVRKNVVRFDQLVKLEVAK